MLTEYLSARVRWTLALSTFLTPVALAAISPALAQSVQIPNGGSLAVPPAVTGTPGTPTFYTANGDDADAITIANGASVVGVGASAITIGLAGSDINTPMPTANLTTFLNEGTVTGANTSSAAALKVGGSVGNFTNRGTMSAPNYEAVYIHNGVTGTFLNDTGGSISAATDSTVRIVGTTNNFTNSGTITQTSADPGEEAVIIADLAGTLTNGAGATISANAGTALSIANGTATVINSGIIRSTSGLAMSLTGNADTVTLMTGSSTTGNIDAKGGTDTLIFDGAGASSLQASQIVNFENITKNGAGTWTPNGNNPTTMAALINAGVLSVNGTMANTSVNLTGGTLAGIGQFGDVTVGNGATVSPGNSVGTLTVDDIIFSNGSIYNIEVSGGTADKIIALGTATIQAMTTFNVTGTACGSSTFAVLQAGTLVGDETNIANAGPTYTFARVGNTIQLTVNGATGRTFTGFTNTANQASTAAALDALGCGNQPYSAALNALTDAQVPAAMDALSGEGHASIAATMIQNATGISTMVGDRLDQALDGDDAGIVGTASGTVGTLLDPGVFDGLDVWGKTYGVVTQRDANGNAAATRSFTGGLLFGAERNLSDEWIGGLMAGIGATGISAGPTTGQSLDATIGAYAGTQIGDVRLKGGVVYTRHFVSTTRAVVFPGVSDTLTAAYQSGTGQSFIEASTDIELKDITLTPFGKLEAVGHATDAFTETGGAGALTTAASSAGALFTTLGIRAEHSFVLGDDLAIRARGSLAWRHAFAGQVTVANSFAGGGPFTVASAGIASDASLVAAGFSTDLDEFTRLDLDYSGELGAGLSSHALKLTIAGSF